MNAIKKFNSMDFPNTDIPFYSKKKSLSQNKSVSLHWHDFFELEYIIDGDGEYIINGVAHKIDKNIMFLSTPSDFQEIVFNTQTQIITIQFMPEMICREVYRELNKPIVLNDKDGVFLNYLNPLCTYGSTTGQYNESFIKHMLNATLFLLMFQSNTVTGKKVYEVNEYFHQTLVYINNHFTEQLSLNDLAKRVNLTPEYLSRLFKKHSGQSISNYVSEIRLNYAYNLVINSQIPINEISDSSGYNSYPHFIRTFKEKYGDSPNRLRKKLQ